MPFFGCVADDFTGASDAASFLVRGGMSVQLFNGIPSEESRMITDVQAVVIALKSRTQKTEEAVSDTIQAFKWMEQRGVKQFYLKYCSTFDSTPEGNIGPAADAAMELLKVPYTILCPALPVNGRTVEQGKLYVNGVLLQESPMKNHPLTPMWDCRIANLMEPQSKYESRELWKTQLYQTEEVKRVLSFSEQTPPFYVIPDYGEDADGVRIADLFGDLRLLTGGSGLLEPLARRLCKDEREQKKVDVRAEGSALLLAGSCSKATLEQIRHFKELGGLTYQINPLAMLAGKESVEDAWAFVEKHMGQSVLIYSSDTAEHVKEVQQAGHLLVADMLEQAAAELADRAVKKGICRIIVAGGETSGAVTKRLSFTSYQIGESVAPGVPVMIPVENDTIRLVLKSGNFGGKDFFEKVLKMTEKTTEMGGL